MMAITSRIGVRIAILGLTSVLLSACASTGDLITAPEVNLTDVSVTEIDLSGQTFLLGFDVSNPNPFPLPVSAVSYGVVLGGYRFASGETAGGFTVPASGNGGFAISVELNLLKTAPQLLYIVRDGIRNDIQYELKGEFGVGIPFAKPVKFKSAGQIRLRTHRR
jgi:LEA14-like dessication related protein